MTDLARRTGPEVVDEVTEWLEANWDPEISVGEWWARLGASGWAAPTWPVEHYGRGVSREDALQAGLAIARFGALGAPAGLGLLLAGPTIIEHATEQQKDRYLLDIVTGRKSWCQLFSEPGAGSDLAGLQTRAERDGDEWVVNGQKVWTSGAQFADLGMLLARTDPDVPKHHGITYFALDMHQPGVEIRPLREMTGRAMFNEVFLTDVRVSDDAVVGGLNNGWAVANTTLAYERAGLGAGGGDAVAVVTPGTVAGELDKRVGDVVSRGARPGGRGSAGMGAALMRSPANTLVELAKANGTIRDPTVRQDLARLHILTELARFMNLRQKALRSGGADIPGAGNIAKLSMSRILRLTRDLGLRILGPFGMLHAYDPDGRAALEGLTGNPLVGVVTERALFAQGPQIYGGTDEIQHNIIGERVLGLPKEPSNDRTVAFRDLPKNA
jgi:alkylation response protein AidB-like acyl-CoA dehydrogenase